MYSYLKNKIDDILSLSKAPFVLFFNQLKYIYYIIKVGFDASCYFIKSNRHKPNLRALTPILLDKETTSFFDKELYAALSEKSNGKIRNIAVSGGYSVGKSSYLLSFKHNHPNFHYVQISLAKFLDVNKLENDAIARKPTVIGGDNTEEDKQLSERIEESITQQLLYSAKTKSLPNSRLQRIHEHSKKKLVSGAISICSVVVALGQIFKAEYIIKTVNRIYPGDKWKTENVQHIGDIIAYTILIAACLYIAYNLYRIFLNSSLSRVSIKSGKIDFSSHGSVLHQHLDEIIYYFEKTNANVVIFEDMDRFDKIEVFNTLREINGLLNNTSQIAHPIYFIYAVKDSLFEQKERVKFFDLLLPIVPVVNSNNAKERLIERLTSVGYCIDSSCKCDNLHLNKILVHTSAFYMDDMRLINNFVNEFIIYKERLFSKASELNINKLYSTILLKNLYPKEYSELLERKGVISDVFNSIEQAKQEYITLIRSQIKGLNNDLIECSRLTELSHLENNLIFTFLFSKVKITSNIESLTLEKGGVINLISVPSDKELFTENSDITHYSTNSVYSPHCLNPVKNTREFKNSKGHSYLESRKYIELLSENKNQKLRNIIKKHESEIKTLNHLSLSELLERESLCNNVLTGLDDEFGALTFLLKQGFFSNDYYDYISYFYKGTLTQNDKRLLLLLRQGIALSVEQNIEKPESFIEELSHFDMAQGKAVNLDLIQHLLNCKHDSILTSIINDCSDHIDKLFEVSSQIENYDLLDKLLVLLNKHNQAAISSLMLKTNENNNEEHLISLLVSALKCVILDDFKKIIEANEQVLNSINSIENLNELYKLTIGIDTPASKYFWGRGSEIKFEKLSIEHGSVSCLDQVLKSEMYQLTEPNYTAILNFLLREMDYQSKSLSYKDVLLTQNNIFIAQVNKNIEKFIELSVLNNFNEDEKSFVNLLNLDDLSLQSTEAVIQSSLIYVSDIKAINKLGTPELLVCHSKIKNTLTNLVSYYSDGISEIKEYDLDEKAWGNLKTNLVIFINDNGIDTSNYSTLDHENETETFIKEIILNSGIENSQFEDFITKYTFESGLVVDCDLNEDKWELFITHICMKADVDIFNTIPMTFIDANIQYLEKFWDDLDLDEVNYKYPFTPDRLMRILNSKVISLDNKIELIFSNLLSPTLNDEDIESNSLFEPIASLLASALNKGSKIILEEDFPTNKLLTHSTNITNKATIISMLIEEGSPPTKVISGYLLLMEDLELLKLFSQPNGHKKIHLSSERKMIINALKKAGYIGSNNITGDEISFWFNTGKFR